MLSQKRSAGFFFDLLKFFVAKEQAFAPPLLVPKYGAALEQAQIFLKPPGVILPDRVDQPVVRKFVPGLPGPALAADEMGIFKQA